jgi:hypothetical protein
MKEGSIVSQGSFDEVVQQNPDFAEHAALAGLHNRDGDDSGDDAGEEDAGDAGQNAAQEFAAKQPLSTRGAGS